MNAVIATVPHDEQAQAESTGWVLKKLQVWHKQLCSLIAQGLSMKEIAGIMDCTPNYVSMLARQPLIIEEVRNIAAFADLQLEAQYVKSVQAISDVLETGNNKEKIMAARTQLEATKRIGPRMETQASNENQENKLISLADRLVGLLEDKMATNEKVEAHALEDIQDAVFSNREESAKRTDEQPHEPAQDAGGRLPNPEQQHEGTEDSGESEG
jgi:hypothetical protein